MARRQERAAAALLALSRLTVDVSFTVEIEDLAAVLLPPSQRAYEFEVAVREWSRQLRSHFEPRSQDPTT